MRISDCSSDVCSSDLAMKIVQAFGQEAREADRFSAAVEANFATAKRRIRLRAIITATVIGLLFGAIPTFLWYGAEGVAQGPLTGGPIEAVVLTGGRLAGAVGAHTEASGYRNPAPAAPPTLDALHNAHATRH